MARSGGPPRLLGNRHPRAPWGGEGGDEWAPGKREAALPGRRAGELQSPQLRDSSCAPGSGSPPVHPPWRPALGEAERKSRLFWMPQAGSATVISFMCHCWLQALCLVWQNGYLNSSEMCHWKKISSCFLCHFFMISIKSVTTGNKLTRSVKVTRGNHGSRVLINF